MPQLQQVKDVLCGLMHAAKSDKRLQSASAIQTLIVWSSSSRSILFSSFVENCGEMIVANGADQDTPRINGPPLWSKLRQVAQPPRRLKR